MRVRASGGAGGRHRPSEATVSYLRPSAGAPVPLPRERRDPFVEDATAVTDTAGATDAIEHGGRDPIPWLTALVPTGGLVSGVTPKSRVVITIHANHVFMAVAQMLAWRLVRTGVARDDIIVQQYPLAASVDWRTAAVTHRATHVVLIAARFAPRRTDISWSRYKAADVAERVRVSFIEMEQPEWDNTRCLEREVEHIVSWSELCVSHLLSRARHESGAPIPTSVAPHVAIQPIAPDLTPSAPAERAANPFLFYGSPTERRARMLAALNATVPVEDKTPLFREDKRAALRSCRAVVNIHHGTTGPWVLEVHRLSEVFAAGCACVTEAAADMQGVPEAMGDALVVVPAGDTDAMADACRAFVPPDPESIKARYLAWLARAASDVLALWI